jgi:hypothetical protein
MKIIFLFLALVLTIPAFARQYIQCSSTDIYSTEVMVVNLSSATHGTLFISSGMQNPESERLLVKIEFDRQENEFHFFKAINVNNFAQIKIPSKSIGKAANDILIDLSFDSHKFTYSCFSRIYND